MSMYIWSIIGKSMFLVQMIYVSELEIIWEIVSGNIYSDKKRNKKLFYLIRK